MKINIIFFFASLLLFTGLMALMSFHGQQKEPWTAEQLMEPADLAAILGNPQLRHPLVISVAPAAVIRNSLDIGPGGDSVNLQKLRDHLQNTAKGADIVIYCGCCPFDKCPNIRPAFSLLNKMQFKNHKLLNITQNLKVNWIDRGYPVNE